MTRQTRIVLSGADEDVDLQALAAIVSGKPWLELGILSAGKPNAMYRYPEMPWILDLGKSGIAPLSLHLCGRETQKFVTGDMLAPPKGFQTLQVNTKGLIERIPAPDLMNAMWSMWRCVGHIVVQVPSIDHPMVREVAVHAPPNAGVLVDGSGGTGDPNWTPKLPSDPAVLAKLDGRIGFAGGLTPETVASRQAEIREVLGHDRFWTDMETGLRTKDDLLDLGKVRQVVETMEAIVRAEMPASAPTQLQPSH